MAVPASTMKHKSQKQWKETSCSSAYMLFLLQRHSLKLWKHLQREKGSTVIQPWPHYFLIVHSLGRGRANPLTHPGHLLRGEHRRRKALPPVISIKCNSAVTSWNPCFGIHVLRIKDHNVIEFQSQAIYPVKMEKAPWTSPPPNLLCSVNDSLYYK